MTSGSLSPGHHSSLRDSQVALTRGRILGAVEELITEGGEPTYAAIAERAAVQERTVYRHFPSRDELYRAFWQYIHELHFAATEATDFDSLLEQVSHSFEGFSKHGALLRAMLHSVEGRRVRLATSESRRARLERIVSAEVPSASPVERRRAAAAAHILSSAMAWEYLQDYWNMSATEASATVRHALTALLRPAARTAQRNTRKKSTRRKART